MKNIELNIASDLMLKRAAIIHQLTNSISEPLFSSALSRARELDDYFSTTGKTLGVLHGCPISVKDSFHVRGVDSCAGIAALAFNPALSNALLVDVLLEAGAVIHCKTNVPQGLGALDSVSNVFGRTLNPWNRLDLTAGGSSGGEGVLVAMRGSVMGCGTDVGGSLRIPGMCTGVIGFKPSLGRVPYGGQESGDEKAASRVQLQASAGPICNSVDDVGVFMEVIERARVWERDPDIVPGKWAADEDTGNDGGGKNLLMGVLRRDGLIDPLPPVNKVLDDVVSMLRRKGVEVVEVEAPKWKDCQAVANRFLGAGSGAHFFHLLEKTGEPLIPWLRGRTKKKDAISLDGLRELYVKKTYLEHAFLDIWRDQEGRRVDAMICPVAPHPVPPIDRWNGVSYTETWNLLDYPAANLPVRLFNEDDIEGEVSKGEPLSSWDRVNRDLCIRFANLPRVDSLDEC